MKIGIFGAGAVGGFLGAKLAASGQDVHFIARDNHLKSMRLNGLTVKSEAYGNTFLAHPQVTDDPEEVGACDVVFLAVKLYDSEEAIKRMPPMIGAGTLIVSLQNGVTAAEPLVKAFGQDAVLGGVAYTIGHIETPGVICHVGRWARYVIGRFAPGTTAQGEMIMDKAPQMRADAIVSAIAHAGLEASVSDEIRTEIWKKFSYLAPLSGMATLLRRPLGEILADGDTHAMLEAAIVEVINVSVTQKVRLEPGLTDKIMKMFKTMPPEMGTAMLIDMLNGRRLEVPWLSGTVSRMGRQGGVATPIHDAIYAGLKLWA